MKNFKHLTAFFLFLLQILSLSAVEVLNNLNTNWSIVIPGKVVTEPALTEYGFSVITDAKLLSTYSASGTLLWEKSINRYRDARLYNLKNDFILLTTNKNSKLALLNPSGVELWNKDLDFQLISAPLSGWDGRLFLCGSNTVLCIGITGLKKWQLDFPELSPLPVQTLPDGSIVVFLNITENGKTKGYRISPFGEVMEEIIFAGKIVDAQTHSSGIALTFTDGSAGFFSLEDNRSENKWVLQNNGNGGSGAFLPLNARFVINSDSTGNQLIYLQTFTNSVTVYKINPKNGQINSSYTINDLDSSSLQKIVYNKSGLFICDTKNAYFYSDSGVELWNARLPQQKAKTDWNYLIYTQDNHLIVCNTNWTLNSYRVSQATQKTSAQEKTKNYKNWYTIDTSDFDYIYSNKIEGDVVSDQRIQLAQKGNYGKEEITYISELLSACEAYRTSLNSTPKTNRQGQSLFDVDSIGTEHIINQLTLYSTDTFCSYEAAFLQTITNKTLLNALLRGISSFGYDPNSSILNALEILSKKVSYKDDVLISGICDAVYSICKFMGRPAFNSKGKTILQNFLSANYSSNTIKTARDTLKKLAALDL